MTVNAEPAQVCEPIVLRTGEGEVLTAPPNSQGLALLETLAALRELGRGEYRSPAERARDFVRGRPTAGAIPSSYPRGVVSTDLRDVLPPVVAESVRQVEWAVKTCEQFGRKVATAEEARQIMKVGVWYNTVEETLFNLGLPPNRAEGQKGFLAYDTDGRLPQPVAAGHSNPTSIL